MNAPTRLAAFAAVLGLVFGGAALADAAIDPADEPPAAAGAGHDEAKPVGADRSELLRRG